jgi:hypothetical protein
VLAAGLPMVCFQTKNPNFGKFWSLPRLKIVDIFYGRLEYFTYIWDIFMTIWYILCSFDTFFPVLVSCTMKYLATLVGSVGL